MRLLVELSGEHPDLPAAEVQAAIEAEGGDAFVLHREPGVLALSTEVDPAVLAGRVALTRCVDSLLSAGTLKDATRAASGVDLGGQSFSVRAVTPTFSTATGQKRSLEAEVGALLAATGRVDLEDPERRFRLILGEEVYLTEVLHRIPRAKYESRRPEERLHTLPISLHPRLARALANLSRVPRGGRLHDPFCGTGGIVIEAALLGAMASGSDISEAMVTRCREELAHLGIEGEAFRAEIGDVPEAVGPVDAVATDPPYGRSTSTGGEPIEDLYRRTFKACGRILPDGGRLAIVLPRQRHSQLAGDAWSLDEAYALRVHKSLTRHFCVFRRH